jgi:hypothetical protein
MDFQVYISEEELSVLLYGRMVATPIKQQHEFRKDTR